MIDDRIIVPAGPEVWPLVAALGHTTGLSRRHLDVDGQAAADGVGSVHGPASKHVLEWTTRLIAPMTAGAEWQIVAVGKNEVVRHVKRGKTSLGRKIVAVVDGEARGAGDLFRALDSGSSTIINVARPRIGSIEC